jgi:fused signal recognition particle receptor
MWAAIKARLRRKEADEVAPTPGSPPAKSTPSVSAPAKSAPASAVTAPAPVRPPGGHAPPPGGPDLFTEGFFGQKLTDERLDEVLDDLEIVLLQSDVALRVVERLRRDLRKDLSGRKLRSGVDLEEAVRECLEHSTRSMLERPKIDLPAAVRAQNPKPYTILFVGVNGTGKTTTVAKFAGWLRAQGLSSVIAAGDTFRAGAIEQLLVHGERLGIRVIRQQEGSDPAAVAFDAVQHARAKGVDVVLVDTAGRQHTNENLIEEAKKIKRVVAPSLTLFVGDALSGNDVLEQARRFDKEVAVDGLILTKLDADTKGGAALSATYVTKKPILFVGVGQGYGDFRLFDPDWLVRRLFAEGAAS